MTILNKLFQSEDKIITDLSVLQQVSRKTSFEECDKLNIFNRMRKLIKSGKLWTQGLGLSAIQIGIDLSALYYEFNDKIVELVNPKIIEQTSKYIAKAEGCLSFPNQRIDTYRYKSIIVEADTRITEKEKINLYLNFKFSADGVEAQIIFHEIDHLNGLTIFDRRAVITPIKKEFPKIGRNDPCFCGSGRKLKKCCIDIYEAQQTTHFYETKE